MKPDMTPNGMLLDVSTLYIGKINKKNNKKNNKHLISIKICSQALFQFK